MGESVIEHVLTIAAPPAQVWGTISDTRRYAEWVPNTLEVVEASSETAGVGVTYRERNRIAGPLTGSSSWRVTVSEPERRTVHEGDGIWIARTMRLEMEVAPEGDGTRYTHRFVYEPALGQLAPLVNLGLRPSLSGDMRRAAENLKALCEREAPNGADA